MTARTWDGQALTPGVNVDKIDVAAGLRMLKQCGYDDPHTVMVIEYALQRWARGEEEQAERGAIDSKFHGINFTSWRMVLAHAVAEGEATKCQHCRVRIREVDGEWFHEGSATLYRQCEPVTVATP